MNSKSFYELTLNSKSGNKDSLLELIERFYPLIKKYSRKLRYDGAETDLIISFIEIIKSIPIINCIMKEEQIIGYISKSIKNKYIQLSKRYGNIFKKNYLFLIIVIFMNH